METSLMVVVNNVKAFVELAHGMEERRLSHPPLMCSI
jgi:hypothetical protein